MNSPITGKPMRLHDEKRTLTFRKEEYEVYFQYYLCEETGDQYESEGIAETNINQVYNQYRRKHNLPFPEEIKSIRERYGLSAAKMAEILGFGTNVYRQYESGEIPNASNARLIQLAKEPREFKKLVALSEVVPTPSGEKIIRKVETLIEEEKQKFLPDLETYFMGNKNPSEFNGYKIPDLEKFCHMVSFFALNLQPYKVKLCKLLFYADFLHFKKHGRSISGACYAAINMGPVPNNFDHLFNESFNKGFINFISQTFPGGGEGIQFVPGEESFEEGQFEKTELECLTHIANTLGKMNTKEIIERSHSEEAWTEHIEKREIINYNYAFKLSQI